MILILLVHLVFERRLRLQGRLNDVQKLRSGTFSLFLLLLFLVYPNVSGTILSSFICKSFDDGSRWLRQDITISCDAPDRTGWLILAGVGVAIYVVGIPLIYIFALWRVRKEINPPDKSQIPDKTKYSTVMFLTEIYKREYYYWEVVELIRKLIQTSLIIFLLDGSVLQMIVMIAVAMVMVQAINELKPYENEAANKLASVAQWELLIVSFLGLLLKVDLHTLDSGFSYNKQELLTVCLIMACFLAPAYALHQHRELVHRIVVTERMGLRWCCGCGSASQTEDGNDDGEEYEVIPFSSASFSSTSNGEPPMKRSGAQSSGGGMMEIPNPIFMAETAKAKSPTAKGSNTVAQSHGDDGASNGVGPDKAKRERMVSFSPSLDDGSSSNDRVSDNAGEEKQAH